MTSRVDFLISSWKSVFSNLQRSSMMTLCYEKPMGFSSCFSLLQTKSMGKERNKKTLFCIKVKVEASTGTLQLGQVKIIRIEVIF